jgi:hypothetical protein
MKTPDGIPAVPPLFFDTAAGNYWLEHSGRFLQLDSGKVKRHLRRSGLSPDNYGRDNLSEVERALTLAELERAVDYAGPLAGHKPGFFETDGGKRVLVTCTVRQPAAKAGKFKSFEQFTDGLLGSEQQLRLYCWLKVARRALLAGRLDFGQMLVFAGPGGCGKSLMQAVITMIMGGRMEKPYQFMIGETPFNAELATAEHWQIEDESARTDIRSRLGFSQQIKAATATREMKIHGKGRQGLTLPTFRRLTLSCNSEAERFLIVPPMESDLADKVCLLKCGQGDYGGDSEAFLAKVATELPGLCHELDGFRIPNRLREDRFGFAAFHHPELLAALLENSPQSRLLSLIDQTIFRRPAAAWNGTADELQTELMASNLAPAARTLLDAFPGACGTYLGRLKNTGRVSRRENTGRNVWTIQPPPVLPA